MASVTARVTGRVQGVGYRVFARHRAIERGLTGEAHNEPDGSVAVTAFGDRTALEAYVEDLRDGPGRVWSIDAQFGEGSDAGHGFRIG